MASRNNHQQSSPATWRRAAQKLIQSPAGFAAAACLSLLAVGTAVALRPSRTGV